jgi:hypothetical protein
MPTLPFTIRIDFRNLRRRAVFELNYEQEMPMAQVLMKKPGIRARPFEASIDIEVGSIPLLPLFFSSTRGYRFRPLQVGQR